MAPRSTSTLAGTAVLACTSGAFLKHAFVSTGAQHHAVARVPTIAAATLSTAQMPGTGAAGATIGTIMGVAGATAAAAGAVRRSRVGAQVSRKEPSLIQVLEQKKLLSTVEQLGLLSAAEKAGLGIETPEQLGLLKLAEDRNLLTLAENTLASPNTPRNMVFTALALILGVYFVLAGSGSPEFFQWFAAGALGAPALVLLAGAFVLNQVFGGAFRTKSLDFSKDAFEYNVAKQRFQSKAQPKALTLISFLETKRILSYAEENGLLTLASGLVKKPLTTTEKLGVLSTLERTGLLSTAESVASQANPALFSILGLLIVTVAFVCPFLAPNIGILAAVLLLLPGLACLVIGSLVQTFQYAA